MLPSVLGWVLAVAALVAAAAFLQRSRSEAARAAATDAELQSALEELRNRREREEVRGDAKKRRDDELSELRKRVEKLKKRAEQGRGERVAETERIQQLEADLRVEQSAHREATEELKGVRGELETKSAKLARLESEVASRPRADTASVEKLEELKRRAEASARAETSAREDAASAKNDETRHRKRADNLDKVYVILRSEHELLKDEHRKTVAELERLSALKVALADPEPAPENAGQES